MEAVKHQQKVFGDTTLSPERRFESWKELVEGRFAEFKASHGTGEEIDYWRREYARLRGETPQGFCLEFDTAFVSAEKAPVEKEAFIERYQVRVDEARGAVAITLPAGVSRAQCVMEAYTLSPVLNGQFVVPSRRIAEMVSQQDFQSAAADATTIEMRLVDSVSCGRGLGGRVEPVWSGVRMVDAITALAASFIATGNDLTGGDTVVANDGAFNFTSDGIVPDSSYTPAYTPASEARARVALRSCIIQESSRR